MPISLKDTANITTANWGTARTLTIGNTGKSVNGSGNVSWSLSEIGAAPAGYGLGTTCQDKSNQDCNNILVTGFYMGSNMTNKPSGCTQGWIYLLVMRHNDSWVRQVAYDFGTASQVYTRVKQNGSWTAWVATDTNTWRGVQDNLTSTATDQSLSANQGKVLKGLIDGKAASNHTHSYLPLSGGTVNGTVTARSIDTETLYSDLGVCSGDFTVGNKLLSNKLTTGNKQLITADSSTVWIANPNSKVVLESSENPKVRVGSNHYTMYHTGNKPSLSDLGAAASSHTHSYLPLSGGTLSGGLCIKKGSKEVWFDMGDNDSYIWSSASNKSIQLKFNGNLDYDNQPIIYGGRGNNYDTAVGTLYFNNSGVYRKGRISCYASENGAGEYVQVGLRDSSSTKNHMSIYDDTVRFGSNNITIGGKRLTIATSAPSNPATGDV